MLVVYDKSQEAIFLALVPGDLTEEQLDAAFREVGIDAEQTYELGGWKTSSQNVAVARVPFPGGN